MKYSISYHNSFNEKYYSNKSKAVKCKHDTTETYVVNSLDMCKTIVKDFLDIPAKELTIEEIMTDFSAHNTKLKESDAIAIQNYYNGRLALYNTIMLELDSDPSNFKCQKYPIPSKYNTFAFSTDNSKQLDSYIEIQKV